MARTDWENNKYFMVNDIAKIIYTLRKAIESV